MKPKNIVAAILNCLLASLILIASNACHVARTASRPAETAAAAGPYAVPQTGQRTSYAAGDDGDLQAGAPWPAPRFRDNGNGTVTDRLSGLMWTQKASPAAGARDWEQALLGAAGCKDGGYSDWRLPNRNELASLIDLARNNPALPEGHPFTGVQLAYYWTSTTCANNEDHAWIIHFFSGFITHDDKGGTHGVWYVRDGR